VVLSHDAVRGMNDPINCPKCAHDMVKGTIAIDAPGEPFLNKIGLGDGTRHLVLHIKFLAEGRKEEKPRLEGTAWMCGECDTVVLVGGW
jgi:hypothetical protein